VVAWTGMRGAVSLAAALSLPLETDVAGAPFPDRELVIFLAYCVVLFTVVVQGLTLPALIRRLGVVEDGSEAEAEEHAARITVAEAALDALDGLAEEDWTRPETVERMRGLYRFRRRRFATLRGDIDDEDGLVDRSLAYQRLTHQVIEAQRVSLVQMRNEGLISAEVMRRIERDLDLEETRLEI
jgi:monovalent cation/hydrogen antiporter